MCQYICIYFPHCVQEAIQQHSYQNQYFPLKVWDAESSSAKSCALFAQFITSFIKNIITNIILRIIVGMPNISYGFRRFFYVQSRRYPFAAYDSNFFVEIHMKADNFVKGRVWDYQLYFCTTVKYNILRGCTISGR